MPICETCCLHLAIQKFMQNADHKHKEFHFVDCSRHLLMIVTDHPETAELIVNQFSKPPTIQRALL